MKFHEIYPRVSKKITVSDISDLDQPLTITETEVTGDKKKTVWLSFEGTSLKHKSSKKDVHVMGRAFKTNDTDDFTGKQVKLEEFKEKVIVSPVVKKK